MSQASLELTEKEQQVLGSYGITDDTKLKFFVRRPSVLFVVSLFTVGLYDVYWFYKNWVAVRDAGGMKISPFWRTVFTVFYAYPLFKIMNLQAKRYGFGSQSPGLLAIGYILVPYIGAASNSRHNVNIMSPLMYGAQLLATAVAIFFLVTAQDAAIHANTKGKGNAKFERFNFVEISLIVFGVLLVVLSAATA